MVGLGMSLSSLRFVNPLGFPSTLRLKVWVRDNNQKSTTFFNMMFIYKTEICLDKNQPMGQVKLTKRLQYNVI